MFYVASRENSELNNDQLMSRELYSKERLKITTVHGSAKIPFFFVLALTPLGRFEDALTIEQMHSSPKTFRHNFV